MRLHLQLTWTVYCVGIMSYKRLKRVAANGVCNVDCMEPPFAEEQATHNIGPAILTDCVTIIPIFTATVTRDGCFPRGRTATQKSINMCPSTSKRLQKGLPTRRCLIS